MIAMVRNPLSTKTSFPSYVVFVRHKDKKSKGDHHFGLDNKTALQIDLESLPDHFPNLVIHVSNYCLRGLVLANYFVHWLRSEIQLTAGSHIETEMIISWDPELLGSRFLGTQNFQEECSQL